MKLIKEVIYEEVEPTPLGIPDMEAHLENNKFTTTPINFYYEVEETDDLVIFMNIYGFPYDESDDGEREFGRVYQVETAILDKRSSELIYVRDNNGFSKVNKFSHLPVWDHDTLKSKVARIRDIEFGDRYREHYYDYI